MDVSVEPWRPEAVDWADVVAFSVPMHTAMRLALEAASSVKARRPDVRVSTYGLYGHIEAEHVDHAIAGEYEAAADALERALATTDDARWEENCSLYFGDKLIKTAPIGETLWDFLFDAIHHRGQLTAYLRPMGGKVPAVYGPSADEAG